MTKTKKQKTKLKNKIGKVYSSRIKTIQDLYSGTPFRGEEEIKKKLDII